MAIVAGLTWTLSYAAAQQRARPAKRPAAAAPRVDAGPPAAAAPASDAGAADVDTRSADGGVKVFRFGEMEIEGRLRSPQLVYFLRRVRAEFAAEDLGHRSFMRELSETRKDPNL